MGKIKKFFLLFLFLLPTYSFSTTYNFYVGNLHSHTSYSDGQSTPAHAFAYARDTAKIDFLAITDHNTQLSQSEFNDIRAQASTFNQDGVFVAIAGQEWTTNVGHSCVYESDHIFTSTNVLAFYNELIASGCSANFNHPTYPSITVFNNLAYFPAADTYMNAMEVRREEEEARYIVALDSGWHIGADGSQDNHQANWGDGPSWTVAIATALTKTCILDAHRNHRIYSTLDRNLKLSFKVNDYWMGSTITDPTALFFTIEVSDPDNEDNFSQLLLYYNGSVATTLNINTTHFSWQFTLPPPTEIKEHYYFVKVVQTDGNKAWSSPVWVKITSPAVEKWEQYFD